jgi:hypothetical protein
MKVMLLLQALVPTVVYGQMPTITAVVNGGSFYGGLSPGSLAIVQGTNFTTSSTVTVGGMRAAVLSRCR